MGREVERLVSEHLGFTLSIPIHRRYVLIQLVSKGLDARPITDHNYKHNVTHTNDSEIERTWFVCYPEFTVSDSRETGLAFEGN